MVIAFVYAKSLPMIMHGSVFKVIYLFATCALIRKPNASIFLSFSLLALCFFNCYRNLIKIITSLVFIECLVLQRERLNGAFWKYAQITCYTRLCALFFIVPNVFVIIVMIVHKTVWHCSVFVCIDAFYWLI